MSAPNSREIEAFAKELSASVRWASGYGQYENDSKEQQAYIDGVNTAIGMMYVDLTGSPKSEGMLAKFAHQELQKALAEKDAWWQKHEQDMYESLEDAHKELLQKVIEAYWTHLESCATGTSEDGKVLYVRVDKEHFDQALKTRDSELQKARAHELEVLAVHLDRQLAGFTSVSLDSVYRYIEQRQEAIQSELDQPTPLPETNDTK